MPVEDKTLKGQLYNIIYAFYFYFFLCEQMCLFSPGCEPVQMHQWLQK